MAAAALLMAVLAAAMVRVGQFAIVGVARDTGFGTATAGVARPRAVSSLSL
jgi:hypothetical protein